MLNINEFKNKFFNLPALGRGHVRVVYYEDGLRYTQISGKFIRFDKSKMLVEVTKKIELKPLKNWTHIINTDSENSFKSDYKLSLVEEVNTTKFKIKKEILKFYIPFINKVSFVDHNLFFKGMFQVNISKPDPHNWSTLNGFNSSRSVKSCLGEIKNNLNNNPTLKNRVRETNRVIRFLSRMETNKVKIQLDIGCCKIIRGKLISANATHFNVYSDLTNRIVKIKNKEVSIVDFIGTDKTFYFGNNSMSKAS